MKNEDLKESIDALATTITTQNNLIGELPKIVFKVNILWTVFAIICGTLLAGILSWSGYMFIEFIRSGGGA